MKNGLTLFLGVFATLALSWAGLLLAAHKQLGALPQFKDPVEETLNPLPLSGLARQGGRHAPVGNIGVVKSGLERLVLDEQPLAGLEMAVHGAQCLAQPANALAHALRAGIVGAVGHPQGNVARAEGRCNLNRVENVRESLGANLLGRIAERAVLVLLVLKEIGIDGAGAHAETLFKPLHFGDVGLAIRQIPKHMQRQCGRCSGQAQHFSSVAEFFFKRGGGSGLHKLAEARAGVGKAP